MLIRLLDVSKIYRTGEVAIRALDKVSLEVEAGEFLAIIGPSGSGKTTLLDIIGCLSRPTEGRYFLDGIDVTELSDAELAGARNRKVGFVFQTFHLLPRATAIENVELPLFYAGISRLVRQQRAAEVLAAVGLTERSAHRPNQLSGGQQQRVAIARALVNRPAILLADEPTGNLDSASGGEIVRLLEDLHRQGHTVILVTHDQELAGRTQRVIALRDGAVVDARGI